MHKSLHLYDFRNAFVSIEGPVVRVRIAGEATLKFAPKAIRPSTVNRAPSRY